MESYKAIDELKAMLVGWQAAHIDIMNAAPLLRDKIDDTIIAAAGVQEVIRILVGPGLGSTSEEGNE